MGGDFAHFFLSAEVDGDGGGVFLQQSGKPGLIFFGVRPAEAGFNRNREGGGILGVAVAFSGEVGGFDHSSTTAGFVDIFVGAAEVDIYTVKAEFGEGGGGFSEVSGVFAPDLSDDGLFAWADLEAFESVRATFIGGVTTDVSKFGEKKVGTAGGSDNFTKNNVRNAFHGGEDGERFW